MLWLIGSIIVALAGCFILAPLFGKSKESLEAGLDGETEADRLLDRKSIVGKNLQDLEFEYGMSRMSEADYRELEAGYKNESDAIQEQLEKTGVTPDLDDWIEKEIAEQKKEGRKPSRCPSCGAETLTGKKFCADCGHPLR